MCPTGWNKNINWRSVITVLQGDDVNRPQVQRQWVYKKGVCAQGIICMRLISVCVWERAGYSRMVYGPEVDQSDRTARQKNVRWWHGKWRGHCTRSKARWEQWHGRWEVRDRTDKNKKQRCKHGTQCRRSDTYKHKNISIDWKKKLIIVQLNNTENHTVCK